MSGENMIYTTGTIAVSGNTLTGTGTNFTAAGSLIRNGCTVIVFSTPVQVFQITAIGSATSLTVTPAANPAIAAGTRYAILLSDSLSVDGLAQDIAETFGMYQRYIGGFADVMNSEGDVTITINGQPVTVPGQKSLAKKGVNSDITEMRGLTAPLSVDQGGTGLKQPFGAAAGMFCQGSDARLNTVDSKSGGTVKGVISSQGNVVDTGGTAIAVQTVGYAGVDTWHDQIVIGGTTRLRMGLTDVGSPGGHRMLWQFRNLGGDPYRQVLSLYPYDVIYTSGNTTKASDGTLKAASPVVKIQSDGKFETNAESEGVTVTRLREGEYLVDGCMGMNSDATWGGPDGGFDIPTDRNKQPLIWLDYKVNADGSVLVKTFHRTHPDTPAFARNEREGYADGDPIDIPADQFVSVRVEMPQNSIWNQKQEADRIAMEEAERAGGGADRNDKDGQ